SLVQEPQQRAAAEGGVTHVEGKRHEGVELILVQRDLDRLVDHRFAPREILVEKIPALLLGDAVPIVQGLSADADLPRRSLRSGEEMADTDGGGAPRIEILVGDQAVPFLEETLDALPDPQRRLVTLLR